MAARRQSGLTQTEVAKRIGKDQSFISLVEGGQRRVDVIEFCAFARALEIEPKALFANLADRLPQKIDI